MKFVREHVTGAHRRHRRRGQVGLRVFLNGVATPDLVEDWKQRWPEFDVTRKGKRAIAVTKGLTTAHAHHSGKHPGGEDPHPHLLRLADELAREARVAWIEPLIPVHTRNAFAAAVLNAGPGFPAPSETITVGDTGLDAAHCDFGGAAVAHHTLALQHGVPASLPVDPGAGINYVRYSIGDVVTDFADFDGGHGTHVMASAVGAKSSSPGTRLIALDLGYGPREGNYHLYVPEDLGDHMLGPVYPHSKIFSASWGEDWNGYTEMARQMDQFVAEHDDFVIVVANGNTGPHPGTVGSPATAKNVISVGASLNSAAAFADYAGRAALWVEEGGDAVQAPLDEDHLAHFSSRGPTLDGRIKPEVLAPGTPIASARALHGCAEMIRHGTSMAAPHVAGLAARIRAHYGSPSAALVKAVLVHKARPVKSVVDFDGDLRPHVTEEDPPREAQGFGLVRLDTFDFYVYDRKDPGGHLRFSVGEAPGPVRVTIAWTDAVAPRGAHVQLVHNVDLEGMPGRAYGNGGARPDTLNNVEQIEGAFTKIQLHGNRKVAIVSSHPLVEDAQSCDAGEQRACRMEGGWGLQHCGAHGWAGCVLQECDAHYGFREGGCAPITARCHQACDLPGGHGVVCGHECVPVGCAPGYVFSPESGCVVDPGLGYVWWFWGLLCFLPLLFLVFFFTPGPTVVVRRTGARLRMPFKNTK